MIRAQKARLASSTAGSVFAAKRCPATGRNRTGALRIARATMVSPAVIALNASDRRMSAFGSSGTRFSRTPRSFSR